MDYYETTADLNEQIYYEKLDADMEMAQMEAQARTASARRKRGICQHGSAIGYRSPAIYPEQELLTEGQSICTEGCGRIFESDQGWYDAMEEARYG